MKSVYKITVTKGVQYLMVGESLSEIMENYPTPEDIKSIEMLSIPLLEKPAKFAVNKPQESSQKKEEKDGQD